MMYAYIDGDDIGLRIEKCLMTNDDGGLRLINQAVTDAIQQLTKDLTSKGFEVIFSGADGVIVRVAELDIEHLQSIILASRRSFSFSAGIGESLQEAFVALRYAKANGKNGVAVFGSSFTWFENRSGIGDAEQERGELQNGPRGRAPF